MKLEWTHNNIKIVDIRKVKNFYIIAINGMNSPLFVDQSIFEARLKSYYLRDNISFSRNEITEDITWNMLITNGYYYKLDKNNEIEKVHKKEGKNYLSFLEISGELGEHIPG